MPGFEIIGEEAMFAEQLEWLELRGVQCAEDVQMDQVRKNMRCRADDSCPTGGGGTT